MERTALSGRGERCGMTKNENSGSTKEKFCFVSPQYTFVVKYVGILGKIQKGVFEINVLVCS